MENTLQKYSKKSVKQPHVRFIALGGEETVTRNMYLYEYEDQILIVDCGLGFPDATMLGVDLMLPDISYLLELLEKTNKKIVGMVLTHGHEDHIGGLPFILPQLMPKDVKERSFSLYASPLTAALINEKLKEYHVSASVKTVPFTKPTVRLGDFIITFVRVTHSVPDSANIIIETPIGNFFHGSDFKFDLTPADGKRTEFHKITDAAKNGFVALMSDCLGSDRDGFSISEESLEYQFERQMREAEGKCIITTYSSNINRMNQIVKAAERTGRKVCFVGRSMIKIKDIAQRMGYLHIPSGLECSLPEAKKQKSKHIVMLVAGSQGQQNSALTRIANGEHRDINLQSPDTVIFSAETIPGNELAVNALIDSLAKRGVTLVFAHGPEGLFHVSGHGSRSDHQLLIALTQPRFLVPISGTYQHMLLYKRNAQKMGYNKKQIQLVGNGREILFTNKTINLGKQVPIRPIYVDEISGEEVESYVIRDREKLAKEGIVIIMAEVKADTGELFSEPEILVRGITIDVSTIQEHIVKDINAELSSKKEPVVNWFRVRKIIGETTERILFKKFRTRPLLLPIVIEM